GPVRPGPAARARLRLPGGPPTLPDRPLRRRGNGLDRLLLFNVPFVAARREPPRDPPRTRALGRAGLLAQRALSGPSDVGEDLQDLRPRRGKGRAPSAVEAAPRLRLPSRPRRAPERDDPGDQRARPSAALMTSISVGARDRVEGRDDEDDGYAGQAADKGDGD